MVDGRIASGTLVYFFDRVRREVQVGVCMVGHLMGHLVVMRAAHVESWSREDCSLDYGEASRLAGARLMSFSARIASSAALVLNASQPEPIPEDIEVVAAGGYGLHGIEGPGQGFHSHLTSPPQDRGFDLMADEPVADDESEESVSSSYSSAGSSAQ